MFITITGALGSGKSAVCGLLKSKYGYEIFSTGNIHRQAAEEMNLSTLELNKQLDGKGNSLDKFIDGKLVELSKKLEGQKIVFDSRMAWHFVPNSLKVFLSVSPRIAAERVFSSREGTVESYKSVDAAERDLLERKAVEDKRFFSLYNVNCTDIKNFDLVVDTSLITPEEAAAQIVDAANRFKTEK